MKLVAVLFLVYITLIEGRISGISTIEHQRSISGSRIIQGTPAVNGQIPHQVNLRLTRLNGSTAGCGGSIISIKWVLTAGHCLIGMKSATIRLGGVDMEKPGLILESSEFVIHPKYNDINLNNDLGLIKLPVVLVPSANMKPVRLPGRSQLIDTQEGEIATVSGWGYEKNGANVTQILNYVNLKIISNRKCLDYFGTSNVIYSTICAAGIDSPSQGTCNGDSGGPMTVVEEDGEITQIGVVSFVSSQGCDAPAASGFARTVFDLEWIDQYTGTGVRP